MAFTPNSLGFTADAMGGVSATDFWAVVDRNPRHWDGSSWTSTDIGANGVLTGVFAIATDDVWVCGPDGSPSGSIWHWDGSAWTVMYTGLNAPSGVWAAATDDVWFAADNKMMHWDGSSFTDVSDGSAPGAEFGAIWGSATDDIYAVGTDGSGNAAIIHWDGSSWTPVAHGLPGSSFASVSGADNTNIYVGGVGGVVGYYNGTSWVQLANPFVDDVRCVCAIGSEVWAVGSFPYWLHSGDQSTLQVVTQDDGYLFASPKRTLGNAVLAWASDDVWADDGGTGPDIYHWNGPGSGGGGGAAPVVTLISPTDGGSLNPDQSVTVDVTCTATLKRAILMAIDLDARLYEVVHDGDSFGAQYQGPTNSRTAISGGFEYVFARDAGWPEGTSLTLKVIAYDNTGTEV